MKKVSALVVIMCAGSFAAAAQEGQQAAAPAVVWPTEWTAFGTYTITRGVCTGNRWPQTILSYTFEVAYDPGSDRLS